MISYSTNMMGPISLDWFRDRDLIEEIDVVVKNDIQARVYRASVGDTVTGQRITESWCGGRIDIYGLDETEYYGGMSEYSLPIMDAESWDRFSDWLDEYETSELKTYEQLLSDFEADTDHQIRWAREVFVDTD